MNRASLKYLVVGLLIGGLVTGGIDASALVAPGSSEPAGAAAVTPVAKKKTATKKKKAKKKKATTKKKPAKKKKAKKKKPAPAPAPAPTAAGIPLVGQFKFNPGGYAGGQASGSHVRLVLPGGSVERGPYFANPNSKGGSYTLISPGGEGGLRTGSYQEPPSPAFAGNGDSLVDRIMTPQAFAFVKYSASTSAKDPQTGLDVPPPSISVSGDGKLSGDLRSFSASWNKQFFNQGSPKPDGSSPGLTRPVSGTYDPDTKAFTLDWTSQIVGGPFNNFTGVWHLEGTFVPTC